MQLALHSRIRSALQSKLRKRWQIDPPEIVLNQTPKVEFGELATPLCLRLAKTLGKSPRSVAEEIVDSLEIEGVRKMEIAGPGYINFYLERGTVLAGSMNEVQTDTFEGFPASEGKLIVEHTNINPNKAAHIGHLRNAAIGDAFVRTLRFSGNPVEVQNYIDNTGVQVADVIVGFRFIENRSVEEVRALIADPGTEVRLLLLGSVREGLVLLRKRRSRLRKENRDNYGKSRTARARQPSWPRTLP